MPSSIIRTLAARVVAVGAVATLVGAAIPGTAQAAEVEPTVFAVTSVVDERDADLADDVCDADPGPAERCTLRAAVMQGNVTPGKVKIELGPRTYRLSIAGEKEDQSARGDLDVWGSIEIVGTTAGRLRSTIDGTGLGDRVLDTISNDAALRNVVITGGFRAPTTETGDEQNGGGIRTAGEIVITDSYVHHNSAGRGGGINVRQGTARIEDSRISENEATAKDTPSYADGGGGILSANATVTIRDTAVERNTSAWIGGGISALPATYGGTVKVERSLIAGNSADGTGGGIDVEGVNSGVFRLDNSTVSGNSGSLGGGVAVRSLKKDNLAVIFESTVAGNTSSFGGGGLDNSYDSYGHGPSVENSILANNAPRNCAAYNIQGYRSLSTDSSCSLSDQGSLSSVSARLGPLADNGGPTRTHALLTGSKAIDAGGHPSGAITDQRGQWRTTAAHSRFGTPHDLGAYESNPTVP